MRDGQCNEINLSKGFIPNVLEGYPDKQTPEEFMCVFAFFLKD